MTGFRVVCTGDAILGSDVPGFGGAVDPRIRAMIRASDAAFTNMEFVVAPPGSTQAPMHHFPLGARPRAVEELVGLGFDLVSLANNHAGDFGQESLAASAAALDRLGVTHAGAGANMRSARTARFRFVGPRKVAVLAVTCSGVEYAAADAVGDVGERWGVSTLRHSVRQELDPVAFRSLKGMTSELGVYQATLHRMALGLGKAGSTPPEDELYVFGQKFLRAERTNHSTSPHAGDLEQVTAWIADARRRADVVLVSVHSHEGVRGDWNCEDPADFLPAATRAFVEAGASAVIGHGPHMLRGIHEVDGVPVLLSLGNFISMIDAFDFLGPETYEGHGLVPPTTPADVHHRRIFDDEGEFNGFDADARFWESGVVDLVFDDRGRASSLDFYPIALRDPDRAEESAHPGRKGVPWLAEPDHARRVIEHLAEMSGRRRDGLGNKVEFDVRVDEGVVYVRVTW